MNIFPETRNLTQEDINQAFQKLSKEEKIIINRMVEDLIVKIKDIALEKRPKDYDGNSLQFSRDYALELLAKVGIRMGQNEKAPFNKMD